MVWRFRYSTIPSGTSRFRSRWTASPRCMSSALNRTTVRRLQTMLDAGLISHKELQPWADSLIPSLNQPPRWLCDVAVQKYSPDVSKSLGDYIWSEPFESVNRHEVDDEHLSSLYLRFERRELSWATFLDLAGRYSDQADGKWICEDFFEMLNELEDGNFSEVIERKQRERISVELDAALGRLRPVLAALTHQRRTQG